MADSEARHSADSARDDQSPADAAADGHAAEARAQIQSLPREGPGAGFSYLRRYTGKDFNTGAFAGYHRPSEDDEDDEGDYAHDEEAPDAAAGGTLKASDGTAPANAPPAVVKRRKSKKAPEWKNTLMLTYACLGAVFGDIGTSPIYVFTATYSQLGRDPTESEILGLMSLIFWSFTLIVVLQYCLVVLFADNRGEGGTIALYSLLCRYGEEWFNTGLSAHERDFTVSSREDLERRNKEAKWSKRRTAWFQTFTMGTVIAGVALLLGDGVLTPAISVLSAVEGIAVAAPATKTAIVPITIVILILLFAIQSFGTNRVGAVFSPVVIIWLLVLAGMGIYNISLHGAGIFKALNPQYMFEFFIHLGPLSWRMMGGVMLSITGTEALFADIGHFSRQSIQLATCVFVYPCLMLQYLGQSSVLLENPHHWETSFWSAVPGKIYWFVVILSVLATVIASQALISASFSVVSQAMRLNLFPPVKIIHTSAHHATQIYSPDVNWVLMVVTVVIVAAFQSSEALAGAYGIAVCMDMLLTTCLVATVMRLVWGWNLAIPIVFFLFFGLIDGAFLSSNLLKVPHGGWLPLVMAIIVAAVMGLWRWGKGRTMQQRWRFKKPYNKMFSLLTSDSAISSTGDGSFAVADLEAMPVMPIDEDEKDFDDDDEEDDDDYYGVPLSAVSSREPGVAGSGASMRRRISVFDVGYPALGFARTMTASGSSVNQERGRRMSVASGSTRSRSLSLGAPVSVSAPIIPNSILVTAPTPAASETMIYGDAKPADEGPSLAVKFGQPAAQQRTSSPVLPTTTTEPHSPTRIAPRFELPLAAAVSDSAIPASGEEHAAAGAIAAPQSFSSNLDGQGPINTNSQSYRSILAQPGLQRTITTESRNIKIITAASQRSQSVSDMPIGDLAVSVTPAGLLDATIPLPRFPGLGIFYTEITSGIPGVFAHVVNNLGTIPECVVFATIQYANYPHIEDKDRLFVTKGLLNGFWKAVITLGYMDEIIDSDWITDEIIAAISRVESRFQSASRSQKAGASHGGSFSGGSFSLAKGGAQEAPARNSVDSSKPLDAAEDTGRTSEEIVRKNGGPRSILASSINHPLNHAGRPVISFAGPSNITDAESQGVVYFLGRRRYVAKEGANFFQRFLVGAYKMVVLFSRAGATQLNIPDDQTIEVGLRVRL